MLGNINGIVESFYKADNIKAQQNMAGAKSSGFSDYLDYALLNGRTGLFGENNLYAGYPYSSPLSGSLWQGVVLDALRRGLKKESEEETKVQQEDEPIQAEAKKKPDWARIRVIRHYQSPVAREGVENPGILI